MNNDFINKYKKLEIANKKFEKNLLNWYNKYFKVYYNTKIKDKFRYHSKRMG